MALRQDLLVIRRNRQTGVALLDPLRWGLIPYLCQDPTSGRKSINAQLEALVRQFVQVCFDTSNPTSRRDKPISHNMESSRTLQLAARTKVLPPLGGPNAPARSWCQATRARAPARRAFPTNRS